MSILHILRVNEEYMVNVYHLQRHLLIIWLSFSFIFFFTVTWSMGTLYFWEYQQRRKEASVSHLSKNKKRTMQLLNKAIYVQYSLWTMKCFMVKKLMYASKHTQKCLHCLLSLEKSELNRWCTIDNRISNELTFLLFIDFTIDLCCAPLVCTL